MATESYYKATDGWRSFTDNHLVLGSSPSPDRAFGDPGAGKVYWGQTNLDGSGNTHPANQPRETYYTHRIGVNRDYFDNGSYAAARDAIAADLAVGRVPWKSFKFNSPSISWAAFASGTGNAAFASFLASVDAIGKGPVMITLHHEPNTTTSTAGEAADHLAMYTQAKTMTDLYPQILLVPCLLAGYDIINRLGFQFAPWVGDAWDVCAFDSYNRQSFNLDGSTSPITPGGANGKKFLTVQQLVGLAVAQIRAISPTKPWALGEWGVRTDPNTPGKAATFMTDLFDYARNNNGYAIAYFDSGTNVNDGGSPWFLDDRDTERLVRQKSLHLNANAAYIPPGGIPKP